MAQFDVNSTSIENIISVGELDMSADTIRLHRCCQKN